MSKFTINIVDPYKNVTRGLAKEIKEILGDSGYCNLMAVVNNKTVGTLQYSFFLCSEGRCIRSFGTAVDKRYQNIGVGSKLWNYMIRKHKPSVIQVCVVSQGGKNLIEKLKKEHPSIQWDDY